MRISLRLAVLVGGVSLVGAAAFLVACSDDTSVTTTADGGQDASTDSAKADTGVEDAGADTAPPFDGGFVVDTFDSVIAVEVCKSLARCCYGTATPADGGADGGTFDMTKCEDAFGRLGFEGSNADSFLKDGGKVVLDQLNSDTCIKKIQAMSCDLPGSEFKAIRTACFGAYNGTVAVDAPCVGSIECQPGLFCKTAGDAGTGVCTPLRGVDGGCGDFNPQRADEACSYRAGGNTGNYCEFADIGAGVVLDAGDWRCAPAKPAGNGCATSLWCDQSVCDPNGTCATPDRYFDPACGAFVK